MVSGKLITSLAMPAPVINCPETITTTAINYNIHDVDGIINCETPKALPELFIIYGVQDTNSHWLMHSRQTVCHLRSTPDKLFVTFHSRQTVCHLRSTPDKLFVTFHS